MAGGLRSGIGSGLENFIQTYLAVNNQNLNRARQTKLDAQGSEQAAFERNRTLEQDALNKPGQVAAGQVATQNAAQNPANIATTKVTKMLGLYGAKAFEMPEFHAALKDSQMGVPADGSVPLSVQASDAEDSIKVSKAGMFKNIFGNSPESKGLPGDTPQGRAQLDLVGINPGSVYGSPAKTPEEIKMEVTAREQAEQPFRLQLADLAKQGRPDPNAARTDRSYQYHSTALTTLQKPYVDLTMRMSRLRDTLAQGTPQADALVAPELMTVMAGGMGSGLRINEAEISRVIGGRSNWESLKAAANKWRLDPQSANSITPNQRLQIHALMEEVGKRTTKAMESFQDAGNQLATSTDPMQHRQILNQARQNALGVMMGTVPVDTPAGNQPATPAAAPKSRFQIIEHK